MFLDTFLYICDFILAMRFCKPVWGIISSGVKIGWVRGVLGWLSVLSVQNGCFVFCWLSEGSVGSVSVLTLQCQNPSYVTDHYPFSEMSFSIFSILVPRDKYWNHVNVFQVHAKDAQSICESHSKRLRQVDIGCSLHNPSTVLTFGHYQFIMIITWVL